MVYLWIMFSLVIPIMGSRGIAIMIVLPLVMLILPLCILFWNGMIRVYLTSVQLGIKHRILAALCGWIPLVNVWYLVKIIRICRDEVEFETQKWELDEIRTESACLARNQVTPDAPGVVYESVMSY